MTIKIAYLLSYDLSRNDGVVKKIQSQITSWEQQGVEVKVFCMTHSISISSFDVNQYLINGTFLGRIKKQKELISDIKKFSPDVIYHRYEFWNATTIHLGRKYKIIAELNTDDLSEYLLKFKKEKSLKSLLRYTVVKILRRSYLNSFYGLIGVTKEIANLASFKRYNKNIAYFPNSIDLGKYTVVKNSELSSNARVGLFFIGSPNQSWHGIDIIKTWAEKLTQYDFHIVGSTGVNTNNLFFHGYMSHDEYMLILKKCSICIGSLALFRNNLSEASPLKVREYIAHGYPCIIGYKDTSFIQDPSPCWLYQYDKNDNLESLQMFIETNKDYTIPTEEMDNISSRVVENNRLKFIKSLIIK